MLHTTALAQSKQERWSSCDTCSKREGWDGHPSGPCDDTGLRIAPAFMAALASQYRASKGA